MSVCLSEVFVQVCVVVLSGFPVCVLLEQLQRQLRIAVCAYQDVAHAVAREKARVCVYKDRDISPSICGTR